MRGYLLLPALGVVTGCTSPAAFGSDTEAEAVGPATRVDGVVVIERVRTGEGVQTSVAAKFLRHAASTESAERLVGSRLLLPASGECASVAELEAADEAAATRSTAAGTWTEGEGEVELVDVGDVTIVAPFAVRLAPRAFPDVGELVSGVFYTSPDVDAPLPAPARYTLEGTGAAALESFQVTADAPADPGIVLIGGEDLAGGSAHANTGADVLLSWEAPIVRPGDATTRAVVYVDVQGSTGQVHRCAFQDDGSALVPGALFTGSSVAVAVHRLFETTVPLPLEADAPNAEAGYAVVRFDLALVGRVEVDARVEPGG